MQKVLLVCNVNQDIGIGHLSRLLALANTLKKDNRVIPEFLIFGNLIKKDELENYKIHNFSLDSDFILIINKILRSNKFDLLVFDIIQNYNTSNLRELFLKLKQQNIRIVSIDALIEFCDILDLIWVPSFNFDISKHSRCKSLLKSGWDSYLIQKHFKGKKWSPGSRVLVLTGGSDITNLGNYLPSQIDQILDKNSEIHWVRGPLSKKPKIPKKRRLCWFIHDAPQQLDELIIQSNYVISVFGISFFEALQYGIPTVVFSPYKNKDYKDLKALSKEEVAMVINNPKLVVDGLLKLMNDNNIAKKYSINSLKKMSINGTRNLSKNISRLINA
tara:strand:+ start:2087 stop:3079 length:993 start_codon:yes stop_codon:yes gene_type:complete